MVCVCGWHGPEILHLAKIRSDHVQVVFTHSLTHSLHGIHLIWCHFHRWFSQVGVRLPRLGRDQNEPTPRPGVSKQCGVANICKCVYTNKNIITQIAYIYIYPGPSNGCPNGLPYPTYVSLCLYWAPIGSARYVIVCLTNQRLRISHPFKNQPRNTS